MEDKEVVEVLKDKFDKMKLTGSPCPKCGYHQLCPCGSCTNRLPGHMKSWIWIDGEIIKCAACGFQTHADEWEDFSLGEYKLHKALSLAISAIEENERLREALYALAHPDGIIRGPITDGPELDELNAILARPDVKEEP